LDKLHTQYHEEIHNCATILCASAVNEQGQ